MIAVRITDAMARPIMKQRVYLFRTKHGYTAMYLRNTAIQDVLLKTSAAALPVSIITARKMHVSVIHVTIGLVQQVVASANRDIS